MGKIIKVPRKLKKRLNNSVLLMNLASIPKGMHLDEWLYTYIEQGIALYEGEKPTFITSNKELKKRTYYIQR